MMKNILDWKTTAVGIVLLSCALIYLFNSESPSVEIVGMLLFTSLVMIFMPDKFISELQKYISKK
jgi:hypothetical protein